ncbi:MAG: FKBP-type peptidyl-prolyl cis-trans isomerase, partial [Paludibacteraceae bacterium]|nr:FKBP-type peptidyl-prolyl cis-trans isomerase [Paludibacteraceae bacterium]
DHDCGGCHGGPEGKNVGKKVRTHYRGTFNDGTQFDSSYDRGEPLEFVCGAGMMIPGFDAAVCAMCRLGTPYSSSKLPGPPLHPSLQERS